MRSGTRAGAARSIPSSFVLAAILCAFGVLSQAPAQQQKQPGVQQTFSTPEAAAQALIQAAEAYDVPALLGILGPGANDLVSSEDPVQDKTRATAFATMARQKQSIAIDPKRPSRAELSVGDDDWPLPIPLVKRNGRWSFDSKAGRQQIMFRRIGENELDAIQICRGFVEAEQEYSLKKHDNSGVNQYAQRIISTPGKQDGLAWQNTDGSWGGPIGETVAKALDQGYTSKSSPYHGYFFKVLKGQGPAAPLGQFDFMVKGLMIGGFALAAAPAQYRVTGVETFIVSHDGIVYQKDLGPNTLTIFKNMEIYNPDKTWVRTDDEP
jgi:Protein of unknown function (DUF2950)